MENKEVKNLVQQFSEEVSRNMGILQEEFQSRLQAVAELVIGVKEDVEVMKEDISALKEDMVTVKDHLAVMNTKLTNKVDLKDHIVLEGRVKRLESTVR